MITLQLILHGRVQGVGMRYFVQRSARQFHLTGSVKNVSNGTVEVIIQGEERVVRTFLDVLQSSSPGYIDKLKQTQLDTDQVYRKFAIKLF